MQEILIEAGRAERQYWRDIWRYRELFAFMAWRDILVRYKQTVIGVAWAIIQPLLVMLIFTVVFGRIAKLPSPGVPYPILVLAALLPWQFFSQALSSASNSLIMGANMVSKIYFPRLVLPTSAVATSFLDFAVSAVFLGLLMLWYGFVPPLRILAVPFFCIMVVAAALGAGLWLAALNVKYRDFRYVVPFIVQLGLYISPVGFSSDIVPQRWRLLYSLNPMVGIIDGFRWALLGHPAHLFVPGLLLSLGTIALLLASALWYFRRTERTFADVI